MRIVVCDDSKMDLNRMVGFLSSFQNKHGITMDILSFSSAQELVKEIENGATYDLFFLDIVMPKINGIDVAKKIRENFPSVPIIYTTSAKDFALEAYEVQAIRYLIKPVSQEDIDGAMEFSLQLIRKDKSEVFLLNTNEGTRKIPYSQIEYVENASRRLIFHLFEGKQYESKCIRYSFEVYMENLLRLPNFIQTHKSFIVNMDFISNCDFAGGLLTMDDGKNVPVSRSNVAVMKNAYLKYLSSGGM